MSELVDIHPTLRLDPSVARKNESHHHWAAKSVIVDVLRSNPALEGEIVTERKTGERIGDIRCHFSKSPPDVPQQCVIEIETLSSNKDRIQATSDHLRHGYAVYWVFIISAAKARRDTEERLSDYLSSSPSLGVMSLADGELSLGVPITWHDFQYEPPWMGQTELRIPTYDRYEDWYCHGDFLVDNQRVSIFRQPGTKELFVSEYAEDGQLTLPKRASFSKRDFEQHIQDGTVRRRSPIRGSP